MKRRIRGAAPLVLVLAAVALAYLPSLSGGRVWDDRVLFRDNPVITGSAPAAEAFRQPYIDRYYRPVTVLALRAAHAAGGGMVLPRVLGLGLHLGLVLLVRLLARRSGAGERAALVAAALFGLHPVLTEAVAWVSCVGDLLAATMLAVAWRAALLAVPAGNPGSGSGSDRRWAWTMLSLGAFGTAILCKETAALFPLVCVALVIGQLRGRPGTLGPLRPPSPSNLPSPPSKRPARSFARPLAVLFAGQAVLLGLWYAARTAALVAGGNVPMSVASIGPALRLGLVGRYVALLVAPLRLDVVHVIDPPAGAFDPWAWLGVTGIVAFAAVAAWIVRRQPRALAPVAWVIAMLVPPVFALPEGTGLLGERYLYLPAVGLAVLGAVLASTLGERRVESSGAQGGLRTPGPGGERGPRGRRGWPLPSPRSVLVIAGLLAATSFGLTLRRSFAWRDQSVLFRQALEADPRAATAAVKLGFAARQAGHKDEALVLYLRTLDAVDARPPALTGLDKDSLRQIAYEAGLLLGERGDLEGAEQALRRALVYDPADERSLGTLGALLGQTGRVAEARSVLEGGVRLHPESRLIRRNLGMALSMLGDREAAAQQYREILRRDPNDREAAALLRGLNAPASE